MAVFELREPTIDGANLSFRVRLLEGSPPRSFTDPALFIDTGGILQISAHGAQDVYDE